MKKLLKLILATTLTVAIFTGCSSDNDILVESETPIVSEDASEIEDLLEDIPEVTDEVTAEEEDIDVDTLFPEITERAELVQLTEIQEGEPIAIVKTTMGDIYIRLFPEQAPMAVKNFQELSNSGYYDGLIFHRVINDFVIQGGDPLGNGTGGESFEGGKFDDEISPYLKHFSGAIAMANSGPNTNGSQFYIIENDKLDETLIPYVESLMETQEDMLELTGTSVQIPTKRVLPAVVLEEYLQNGGRPDLDGGYTVFGNVYEGMDVVTAIGAVETENEKPVEDVIINTIEISTYTK